MSRERLKLLFAIEDLHIGGAERLLVQFIGGLDPCRFEISLLCLNNRGALFRQLPPVLRRLLVSRSPLKIYRWLRELSPDIVHCHLIKADFLAGILSRFAGVPVLVSTRHNVRYFRAWKRLLVPCDAANMRRMNAVVTISDAVTGYYRSDPRYAGVNFERIYNGVQLEPFLALHPECPPAAIRLLTVGTFTQQKGHREFLEVLAALPDSCPWEWHLVGAGPLERSLRAEVERRMWSRRVLFHGTAADIREHYAAAHLLVIPSLWEGFGLVALEGMASGLPLFASRVDGLQEVIEDGVSGVLFDGGDPRSAAVHLQGLIENLDWRRRLAVNARARAGEFTLDRMTREYSTLYEALRANIRPPS